MSKNGSKIGSQNGNRFGNWRSHEGERTSEPSLLALRSLLLKVAVKRKSGVTLGKRYLECIMGIVIEAARLGDDPGPGHRLSGSHDRNHHRQSLPDPRPRRILAAFGHYHRPCFGRGGID